MAKQCSSYKHGFIFFLVLFMNHLHTKTASTARWQPMQCVAVSSSPSCSSFLYAISEGRNLSEIAAVFNGSASLLHPIKRASGVVDVLVGVPCTCEVINSTMSALFHDTLYLVRPGDTPENVMSKIFSELAMNIGDGKILISGDTITVHLPCGCSSGAAKGVLSYAVQEEDTLPKIASLFRASSQDILNLNPSLVNPDFVQPGWILFVPMGVDGSSKESDSLVTN
ncbi:hypothetical protein C2845_PM08G16730 [Panicum miliaceum]|uniref:LysM domain-containing protein n=1 Tax=Panicum miliaceum TaxID=4540 RepID=A0A3L6R2N4_PANMI|nr:hypothetical protein C2845_PM08G16730 [Panicum miliaceum]